MSEELETGNSSALAAGDKVLDKELEKRREALLKMAPLQAAIRSGLQAKIDSCGISAVAKACGVHPKRVRMILARERPVCKGQILAKVTEYIGRPELKASIEELSEGLAERHQSLSCYEAQTIDLVFGLLQLLCRNSDVFNVDSLSAVFAPHAEVVAGILHGKGKSARKVDGDEELRSEVRAILQGQDLPRILAEHAAEIKRRFAAEADKLKAKVDILTETHGSFSQMVKTLGVPVSTLRYALRAGENPTSVSMEKLSELIELCDRHLSGQVQAEAESQQVEPKPEAEDLSGKHSGFSSTEELFDALAGGNSPDGIRWVLGPDVFRKLKIQLAGELVEPTRHLLQMTRAMLNLLSQSDNEDLRKRVQEVLGKEVEELEMALQLFSSRHPHRLSKLHQERRELWAGEMRSMNLPKGVKRKKATKKRRAR